MPGGALDKRDVHFGRGGIYHDDRVCGALLDADIDHRSFVHGHDIGISATRTCIVADVDAGPHLRVERGYIQRVV